LSEEIKDVYVDRDFQQSAFIKDHPEIVSGDGDTLSSSSQDRRWLAESVKAARFGQSEATVNKHSFDTSTNKRRRLLHSDQMTGQVKVGAKSSLSPPSVSDLHTIGMRHRRSNWLQEWSTEHRRLSIREDENMFGDDDYVLSVDIEKLVFKQCNILSYRKDPEFVLQFCGKLVTSPLIKSLTLIFLLLLSRSIRHSAWLDLLPL
jgi:hypothetical protein